MTTLAEQDPTVPDMAVDGIFMAKMFGPFNPSGADASGMLQNVPAQPGQEFEARVFAQTAAGDSILGTENYNLISLSFLDASGAVIQEELGREISSTKTVATSRSRWSRYDSPGRRVGRGSCECRGTEWHGGGAA